MHQLRVAAIAEIICNNISVPIDKDSVVKACLMHDMGNIIKFKLEYFPEFTQPEGLEYWENIQNEYIQKYGKNEHYATVKIINELEVDSKILELVDSVGFLTAKDNKDSNDFNRKICEYADMRVIPSGVVSLEERFNDVKKRYDHKDGSSSIIDRGSDFPIEPGEKLREIFETSLIEIEKQIFEKCRIKPDYINDETVASKIELLKEFVF